MIRLQRAFSLAILAGVSLANSALAQTPAAISIVSGNGQLACAACTSPMLTFEPMIVLVTDANGNPVSGATINWTIPAGGAVNSSLAAAQTTTGSDGTTKNNINALFISTRTVYNVVASLPNSNSGVIFTLTAGVAPTSTDYATLQPQFARYLTISGSAGGTGSPALTVKVLDLLGNPIPNISVRLAPDSSYTPGATATCATGNGADPGSVLTDPSGTATCTPTFGPVVGSGTYQVLIGGVANAQTNGTGPLGYATFGPEFINVSPGVPAVVRIISGSAQSANPGQALAAPLVAEVDSGSGGGLSGVAVTWSVSPSGAATLSTSSSTSDSNGRVSTNVTLASSATGTVQVTATTGSLSVTFVITVNVAVTGITKSSGDGQTTPVSTAFANPLVVQVTTAAGQSAANLPITFAVSGPGTLSATSVNTNSSGQASVTVTAGSSAGTVTVTATYATFSVSFTLTVSPPGPAITPSSFVNGAGFYGNDSIHSGLAPCAVGTVIAAGLVPGLQGVVTSPMFGPLSYQLSQVTITFGTSQAPLYSVSNVNGQQQVSFQVPCDVTPSTSVPVTVNANGGTKTVNVSMRSAAPGVFLFTDSDGLGHPVIVRPDGSYASAKNPVHRGETVRLYITGVGSVQPALATNTVPVNGTDSVAQSFVVVGINNAPMRVVTARRAPDLVGVDEITFQVDPNASVGNQFLYVAVYPNDNPSILVSNLAVVTVQ